MKADRKSAGIVCMVTCVLVIAGVLAVNGQDQKTGVTDGNPKAAAVKTEQAAATDASAEETAVPEAYSSMPVGSVVAWMKSLTGTPALPAEWVECNGQQLSMPNSPYNGVEIPNLNGANKEMKRFLRGSTQSGAVGGTEEHSHGLFLTDRLKQRRINVSARNNAKHVPPFYAVTWIMKVQ